MRSTNISFIYGALRSGTTVFRLMLDHHSSIANPGELDFLFDYLQEDPSHPSGWRYDIRRLKLDRIFHFRSLKIPLDADGQALDGLDLLDSFLDQIDERYGHKLVMTINLHRHIDKVFKIFPDVQVIHILRDPRDVARSTIGMGWAVGLYEGIDLWIQTERAWDAGTFEHIGTDQILTITYEDLFRDLDGTLRKVCAFYSLPWDDGMLTYHENSSYSPPNVALVEQWRHKCAPDEIALLEGKAGDLMQARGYTPTGPGRTPRALEKVRRKVRQKTFRWQYQIKRVGPNLFITEKAARWLRLRGLHARTQHRINAIHQSMLK